VLNPLLKDSRGFAEIFSLSRTPTVEWIQFLNSLFGQDLQDYRDFFPPAARDL
jgi:hypothetical protein